MPRELSRRVQQLYVYKQLMEDLIARTEGVDEVRAPWGNAATSKHAEVLR